MPLDREATLAKIQSSTLIAVIRGDSAQQAVDACRALRDGGVVIHEIAMTTPDALDAIRAAVDEFGDTCVVGVGTVLTVEQARGAIDAGAAFVFAPNVNLDVIAEVKRHDKPIVPGALTPTEIVAAWDAGADMVKVFPANHFGPRYLRDIHGPLPHVKLTPTGGVELDNVGEWLNAGAAALGVGSALVRKDLMRSGDWNALSQLAKRFVDAVAAAKA
ncbi:MAG: bifunctional 4-hydroxy-2-oxoglutarate aldolase/2-dehydro-3-deoxy-phosphogluconate aldolase [Phycisphaera sp.]|nr:bifunctional 4-hydroxy-2-oxoglutarate aldolase/2-dehydro-3-deoxy-phosphogluconate aldolase [Phycisphaera sp.]